MKPREVERGLRFLSRDRAFENEPDHRSIVAMIGGKKRRFSGWLIDRVFRSEIPDRDFDECTVVVDFEHEKISYFTSLISDHNGDHYGQTEGVIPWDKLVLLSKDLRGYVVHAAKNDIEAAQDAKLERMAQRKASKILRGAK